MPEIRLAGHERHHDRLQLGWRFYYLTCTFEQRCWEQAVRYIITTNDFNTVTADKTHRRHAIIGKFMPT